MDQRIQIHAKMYGNGSTTLLSWYIQEESSQAWDGVQGLFLYLMVSLGVKSLQDENFCVERPFGVRLQLHQLVAIIQRLGKDVSINSRGLDSEINRVDMILHIFLEFFTLRNANFIEF
jgi:hypothetical protein